MFCTFVEEILLNVTFLYDNLFSGTISPLDQSKPLINSYNSLTLLIPSSCALIVLIVVIFLGFNLICKPKDHLPPGPNSCIDGSSTVGTLGRSSSSGHGYAGQQQHSHNVLNCSANGSNIYFDESINGSNHCPAHHGDIMVQGHLSVLDTTRTTHRHHHLRHLNSNHGHSNRGKESCLNEMNLIVSGSNNRSCNPDDGGHDIGDNEMDMVHQQHHPDMEMNCGQGGHETQVMSSNCTPNKLLFYPSPYSIEHSSNNRSSVLIDPNQQSINYHHEGSDKHNIPGHDCHSSNNGPCSNGQQQSGSMADQQHHHTYAIPFPPKWV